MKFTIAVLLYTALSIAANPLWAQSVDMERLAAARDGDMRLVVIHDAPKLLPESSFEDFTGAPVSFADYAGKVTLVNFWATWCAPCREEMPSLAALQTTRGGPDFEVVTIATGRNPPASMEAFFDEIGIENLPKYRDPQMRFSRQMGVLGLPVSILIDAQGRELGRLQGEADWNTPEVHMLLDVLGVGGESLTR